MKLILTILTLTISVFSNGQFPNCIILNNGNQIEPLTLNKKYYGQIIVNISIDTTRLVLKDYELVYAKLKSRNNSNDTIFLNTDSKAGNITYLKKVMIDVKKYLQRLKINRLKSKDCNAVSRFRVPVNIE